MVRPYGHQLKGASRKLRKQMTDAEQLLWSHLRGKQLLGIQFNRQKLLGPYVVDFYAAAALLGWLRWMVASTFRRSMANRMRRAICFFKNRG
ncbi:endonuclease domain-containing protein [Citrifermentans bemidjiense]|nr:DUF559 domain-containing protein [Citrifermentans bemidjiense]